VKNPSRLPDGFPNTLLYRRFEQELTDKRIEQAIFEEKSADRSGPKLYFQNEKYRIEGFFEGRPITIWEMRNPVVFNNYSEIICRFNFSKATNDRIQALLPNHQDNLFVLKVIKEWGPALEAKLPKMKSQLKACAS
jgi:hypothetical protein